VGRGDLYFVSHFEAITTMKTESIKKAKWFLLPISIMIVFICVFECLFITNRYMHGVYEHNKKFPSEQLPIRTLSIEIPEERREDLFASMQKFSENHDFEYHLSFYDQNKTFYIVMDGEKVVVRTLSMPITTTKLAFRFFEKDPTNPPSEVMIDELFNDLKLAVSEIPDVIIVAE
jgi:hypothetical protein